MSGSWVHIDGAFGLWARANPATRHLTKGIDGADSWTTDGHKWLNTAYDGAMGICRDSGALAGAMNSDAVCTLVDGEIPIDKLDAVIGQVNRRLNLSVKRAAHGDQLSTEVEQWLKSEHNTELWLNTAAALR